MEDVTQLERLILTFDRPLPNGASLMIDVAYDDEGSLQTEYYYADHNERDVFFLHPSDTNEMLCTYEVRGPKSYPHLGILTVLAIKVINLLIAPRICHAVSILVSSVCIDNILIQ